VLPRVSKSLDGGLVRRGCQLASLITWSERLSQSAYSTAAQEKLSAEIRQIRGGDSLSGPPLKRTKLDLTSSSSKWRLANGWSGCEPGLDYKKELDMKFLHSLPVHHLTTCFG
jgi:hypothetical protein